MLKIGRRALNVVAKVQGDAKPAAEGLVTSVPTHIVVNTLELFTLPGAI